MLKIIRNILFYIFILSFLLILPKFEIGQILFAIIFSIMILAIYLLLIRKEHQIILHKYDTLYDISFILVIIYSLIISLRTLLDPIFTSDIYNTNMNMNYFVPKMLLVCCLFIGLFIEEKILTDIKK